MQNTHAIHGRGRGHGDSACTSALQQGRITRCLMAVQSTLEASPVNIQKPRICRPGRRQDQKTRGAFLIYRGSGSGSLAANRYREAAHFAICRGVGRLGQPGLCADTRRSL